MIDVYEALLRFTEPGPGEMHIFELIYGSHCSRNHR
jgi:hypothetical protein